MMIDIQNELEWKLWHVILESYKYDEDTELFLREIRHMGIENWLLQKTIDVESDVVFLKYSKDLPIFDGTIRNATIVRRVLEILIKGNDSGKYLGPGDDRLRSQSK